MPTTEIKSKAEFDEVLKQGKVVVVDFTATWCGPCQRIGPKFKEMSDDASNNELVFLKVDVDACSDVSEACKIAAMPTFQVYKNGEKVDELVGASEDKLKELIAKARSS